MAETNAEETTVPVEVESEEVIPQGNSQNSGNTSASPPEMKNVQELTIFVERLLQQMQERFQGISDQVLSRIDEMSNRIDDLERNIAELVTQSGVDGSGK